MEIKDNGVHVDYFDPNTNQFSNPQLAAELGAAGAGIGGFDIFAKRPYFNVDKSGRITGAYFDRQVGRDVKTNQRIFKPVKTNAATLMRDEWIAIDTAVKKIARERLIGVQDLRSRNLIYALNNAMGKTVLEYQDMNDPGSANMNMEGIDRGQNDAPEFVTKYMPLPIIYGDFSISDRTLQASRNSGDPLDTIMVEAVTRRCMEKLEDLLFTNTTFTYGGGSIYSYLSYPSINSVTLSENWDASGKTGAEILTDVQNMMNASIAQNHYGPWVLYIPKDYQIVMGDDYTSGYPKTVRSRLMELQGLSDIKVADRLPDNTCVLVEMNTGTVRLVDGFAPTVLQWSGSGGMVHHFKIMSIQVPQMRADQSGQCGITVLS